MSDTETAQFDLAYASYKLVKDELQNIQKWDGDEFYNEALTLIARYEQKLVAEGRAADIYTPAPLT